MIYYEFKNIEKLNDNKTDGVDVGKIKIDSPDFCLCLNKRKELKYYGGIKVTDIESISFLPHKNNDLGFDEDSVKKNLNIWKHLYEFKERRGKLSDEEKKIYNDIQCIQWMSTITKLLNEIKKSGSTAEELVKNPDVLKKIIESCKSFDPSILLYGKKQVYWDIDSYLHIIIRHIKDYQLGKFKEKNTLPL